jgi:hypothetical protein
MISRPTTGGNIIHDQEKSEKTGAARQEEVKVIHRDWLSAMKAGCSTVHNSVEKLARW